MCKKLCILLMFNIIYLVLGMPERDSPKPPHPIKRIREAIGSLPEDSGAHRLSRVKDFSRWIGCSESLIRNVENGVVACSRKLARAIESKTEVSAEWLLSADAASSPILDQRSKPWSADRLDWHCNLPNFERLLAACPSLLPGIVAQMVEEQMLTELHKGEVPTMLAVLSLLKRRNFFDEDDSRHAPMRWPEADDQRMEQRQTGIGLLMDQSADLAKEQCQALDYLRATEPPIPEDSELLELYTERGKKKRRRQFFDAR